jgi:hypothetical protein
MRVRPLVLILFWGTAFIWVGYNGMQAVSSYFQTNDVAEQAFRDASERQRQRNPGGLVRVTVSWTYRTWPLTTWGWDTGVPVPLWLGRSFDPQLGTHRFF